MQDLAQSPVVDRVSIGSDLSFEFGVEQLSERTEEVSTGKTLGRDVDAGEQPEAEFATNSRASVSVDLVAASDSGHCLVDGPFHRLELDAETAQQAFRFRPLGPDASLLLLEERKGDGVGVVSLEQLLLLRRKSFESQSL